MKCPKPICRHTLGLLIAGWFLLAVFMGESRLLPLLPARGVPLVTIVITAFLLGAFVFNGAFRAGVDRVPNRVLLGLHLSRFTGLYFLALARSGQLDSRFSILAGWNEVVIALGALALLLFRGPKWLLLAWNVLGLIGILGFVTVEAALRFPDPEALSALAWLYLSLLPAFIVPLVVAAHLVLIARTLAKNLPHTESQLTPRDPVSAEL